MCLVLHARFYSWTSGFFEGNTERPSRGCPIGRCSMPAPNFTGSTISNWLADFSNPIRLSAGAGGLLLVNSKDDGERHEH